jgi:hypothetical protein
MMSNVRMADFTGKEIGSAMADFRQIEALTPMA